MKILKIYNDVFEFEVLWIITEDKKEVYDYLISKGINCEMDFDNIDGYTHIENDRAYLYLTDRSDYVIIHECIHIIQHIFYDKGIETGFDNTEVLAYNVDWLYRKLLYAYYKDKKDKRYKDYE